MTTATQILRNEHDVILRMLDATERTAEGIAHGDKVRPEALAGLLEFFRLFADRCHHGKEEDLLFPLLEQKGLPRNGGPIGVMLMEHDHGRALIRAMAEAGEAYGHGDEIAAARWAGAARDYCALLREHIMKENNILFMMAERILSEAEQLQLAVEFERVELEKMGAGTHERLHAQMEKLLGELAAAH